MEDAQTLPADSTESIPLRRAADALASQRFAGAIQSGRPRKWSIEMGSAVSEISSRPGENAGNAGALGNGEKWRETSRVEKVWEKLERTLRQIDRKKSAEVAPIGSDVLPGLGALENGEDCAKRCTVSEEVKALADKLNVRRPRRQSWDEQGNNAESAESRERHSVEFMHATRKQWQLVKGDSLQALAAIGALHYDRTAESTFRAGSDELARSSTLVHEPPRLESGLVTETSNKPNLETLDQMHNQEYGEATESRQPGSEAGVRERLVLQRVDGRLRWTPEGGSPVDEGIAEPRPGQWEPEQKGGGSINQANAIESKPRRAVQEIGGQYTAPSSEHETETRPEHPAGRNTGGATSVSHELLRLTSVAESIRRRAAGGVQITSSSSRRPESGTSALRVARSMQEAQGLVLGAIRKQRELVSELTPSSVKASADSSVSPSINSQREGLNLMQRAWTGEQVDSEVVIRIQMRSPRGRQEIVSAGEGVGGGGASSTGKYLHEGRVKREGEREPRSQIEESGRRDERGAGQSERGAYESEVNGRRGIRERNGVAVPNEVRQDADESSNGSGQAGANPIETKIGGLGALGNAEEEGSAQSEAEAGRWFDKRSGAVDRGGLENDDESTDAVAVAAASRHKTGGQEQAEQREGGGKLLSGLRDRSTSMGQFASAESSGALEPSRLENVGVQAESAAAADVREATEIEHDRRQSEGWGKRSATHPDEVLDVERGGESQSVLELEIAAPCDDELKGGVGSAKDFFTPRKAGGKEEHLSGNEGRQREGASPGGVANFDSPSSAANLGTSRPAELAWGGNGQVSARGLGEETPAQSGNHTTGGSTVTSPSEGLTSRPVGSRLSRPTAFGWRPSGGEWGEEEPSLNPGIANPVTVNPAKGNPANVDSATVNRATVARPAERRLSLESLPLDGERAGFAARAKAWRERLGTCAIVSSAWGPDGGCKTKKGSVKKAGVKGTGECTEDVGAREKRNRCDRKGGSGAWGAEEWAAEKEVEEERQGRWLGRPGDGSEWLEAGSEKIRAWDGDLPGELEGGTADKPGGSEEVAETLRVQNSGAVNRETLRKKLPEGRGRSRRAAKHRYTGSKSASPSSGRGRNGRPSADSRIGREKQKRGGKQSRPVSGESTGRSKPGGERSESFSPRRSRFFEAVPVSREDRRNGTERNWKTGCESSSGSSNGDNFERETSVSAGPESVSPEAERNGGTEFRFGREERRGRSVTRSEHRSRPRSRLSTSPRSRSYDRRSAQRKRTEMLRARPKTDGSALRAVGRDGTGILRNAEAATKGGEAVLFGGDENMEKVDTSSKAPPSLETLIPSVTTILTENEACNGKVPPESGARTEDGSASATNGVVKEKKVSGPLLDSDSAGADLDSNGNARGPPRSTLDRLTGSVSASKGGESAATEQSRNAAEDANVQPERDEGFEVLNGGRVDAAVFLSAAGRLRAAAQQVRAWVEVGEQAKLQGLTDTILGICEETALAALKAAGTVEVAEKASPPALPYMDSFS
ncbi:hypothetical protein KFL_000320250 [Klebsormidium nitens]|uniref:Uncharacterized protein n=1 Tax=Klebsormidium nitens TaxID=105231 RepID=A0A1Y1HSI6_KLENI|nr:hypothetical protein KFL_000320250 [Klebsormidium nitens]|eukprot:GAQ79526.1 hypothetical protein KFL_000320250 [Klebsormidium nitens]